MNWESLIAFNVILAAAIVSPGAALLYFLRTTVASGRMAGLLTGFGLALAELCGPQGRRCLLPALSRGSDMAPGQGARGRA